MFNLFLFVSVIVLQTIQNSSEFAIFELQLRIRYTHAQAMLHLRSANLNGDLDEFSQYRIQQQAEKLYRHRDAVAAIEWPMAA